MKIEIYSPQAIYELGGRSNQEDSIFPALGAATDADRLFMVCDGMGGHEHGEVASQNVAQVMSQYLTDHHQADQPFDDELLRQAVEAAFVRLDELDDGAARKMGTTLTFLMFHRGGVTVAHIGDSRIYHLRPSTKEILYVSRDHSLVMDLYQAGELTRAEMRTSPQKNIITRAMSPGEDNRQRADIVHITDVKPGDYFYLCSDGMLEQMEDNDLLRVLSTSQTDEEKRAVLIKATELNKDNHSAYLLKVKQVVSEEGDENLLNDEATSRYNAMNIYRRREAEDAEDVSVVTPTRATPPPYAGQRNVAEPMAYATPEKRSKLPLLVIALAALAIIGLAAWWLLGSNKKTTTTTPQPIPDKVEKPNVRKPHVDNSYPDDREDYGDYDDGMPMPQGRPQGPRRPGGQAQPGQQRPVKDPQKAIKENFNKNQNPKQAAPQTKKATPQTKPAEPQPKQAEPKPKQAEPQPKQAEPQPKQAEPTETKTIIR